MSISSANVERTWNHRQQLLQYELHNVYHMRYL